VRRGLTLLEVLVTLALIAAASALVLPAILSRVAPLSFDEATVQVEAVLREAQARARREGTAMRIVASRPSVREPFVLSAEFFGPDDDPTAAWLDASTSEEITIGDSVFDAAGNEFPLPDAALPSDLVNEVTGKLLLTLPRSVRVERSGGSDEPGSAPGFDGSEADESDRSAQDDAGEEITLAVVLSDGAIAISPGASVVSEQGRVALLNVDAWSGLAFVSAASNAQLADGFEPDEETESDLIEPPPTDRRSRRPVNRDPEAPIDGAVGEQESARTPEDDG